MIFPMALVTFRESQKEKRRASLLQRTFSPRGAGSGR